jgi:D-beta-D-heptose 7-phosphate kinase / D-beta-D-heptose 1-phosphate adenosyltransferase
MSDLARIIEALPGAAVLCVGDVMLDRYVYGTVDRVSPEAPIPVLRIQRETSMIGGAGNVAANVVALGASCAFVSAIGDDAAGAAVRELAEKQLGGASGILIEPRRRTTVKTRFVAGQQLLRADSETVAPVAPAWRGALLDEVRKTAGKAGAMVLSDYGKGVLTDDFLAEAIAIGNAAGLPVVVDPKGSDYRIYRGATAVTPNRKELAQATGLPTGSDDEVVAAGRHLIETCGVGAVVATRSERGMTVVSAGGEVAHLPALAREVFDVSGAGDTVVAVLAAALAAGAPLTEAARIANLAAGIVVGKVGTAVVRLPELLAELHEREWREGEAKTVPVESAQERVARWRRQGKRVGFTNGCFDLLHPGHLSLLNQAKAACDRLIVGLNSDESVGRLKGPTRPVQSEGARAAVLAALAAVDLVVIFGEDTPEALIRALRPDVLVKGADYTVANVVGADFVQSYGGSVVLAELVAGQSTTNTIKKLNGG